MDNKLIRMLRKKSQQTLKQEEKDIQNRQAILRKRKEALVEERDQLREALYAAMKAGDDSTEKLLNRQISDIKDDLAEINTEGEANAKILECYSKVIKDRNDSGNTAINTLCTAVSTGGALFLGKKALDYAYKSNEEGLLVNKGPLDFFNRLNPVRILSAFVKK